MYKFVIDNFGSFKAIKTSKNFINQGVFAQNNIFLFASMKNRLTSNYYVKPKVQIQIGEMRKDQRYFNNEEAKRQKFESIIYHKDPNQLGVKLWARRDRKVLLRDQLERKKMEIEMQNEERRIRKDDKRFVSENSQVFQQQQYQQSNSYGAPRSDQTINAQNGKTTNQDKKYNPMGNQHQLGSEPYHQKGGQQSNHPMNNHSIQYQLPQDFVSTSDYNTYEPANKN